MPVSREAKTGYPVIYGSGMKGALRDKWRREKGDEKAEEEVFGKQDNVGGLAVTDARLLLLPIRSLNGHFKLATCPYLLRRLKRDLALVGLGTDNSFQVPTPGEGQAITTSPMKGKLPKLYLEEYVYEPKQDGLTDLLQVMSKLIKHQEVMEYLADQLVVLCDNDFSYFASYGLPVVARNELYDDTKISKNLWYEEHLPSDTLLYSMVIPRKGKEAAFNILKSFLQESGYLQVGGNETVGQGWCALTVLTVEGGGAT